jgi:hypothetical protein
MRGALARSGRTRGRARHWLLAVSAAAPIACGEANESPAVSAQPPVEPQPLSGLYEVSGRTVDKATGSERNLSGTVIVAAEGESYTTTFNLNTTIMSQGDASRAELIGKGEGRIVGRTLEGNAETQLIVALVPGVDANFGMLPRHATARILNQSKATIADDGTVRIEIESEAAPGTEYAPTHTMLRGHRVGDTGAGPLKPQP